MKVERKNTLFALFLSLLVFIGAVFLLILVNNFEKLSEHNTTEYTATVTNIEMKGSGTGEYGKIYTEEYGELYIYYIRNIVDMDDFNNLQAGQTVFFRIENIWLEKMDFIKIVSLKTAEKEMFSLSSYAEYMEHQYFRASIPGIIIIPICLLAAIHFTLLLKGINIFRRFKNRCGLLK